MSLLMQLTDVAERGRLVPITGTINVGEILHLVGPNGAGKSTLLHGIAGVLGMAGLALWQPAVPAGAEGFILRGWVWPSGTFLWWTFVQAAGSMVAVGLMVRAYQLADASRVSVFEYVILPISAAWKLAKL